MGFKDKFELKLHFKKGRARGDLFSLVIALDIFACNAIIAQPWSMPILFLGPLPEKKKNEVYFSVGWARQFNVSRAMQLGRQLEVEAQTRTNLCL